MPIQMGNFSSWKKVLLVAIATFALILSGCGRFGCSRSETSTMPAEIETLIDDTVRDLLQDASTEQEESLGKEAEAALLGAEDVLPQDIGESADER